MRHPDIVALPLGRAQDEPWAPIAELVRVERVPQDSPGYLAQLRALALDRQLAVIALDLRDEALLPSVDQVVRALAAAGTPVALALRGPFGPEGPESAALWRRLRALLGRWRRPLVQVDDEDGQLPAALELVARTALVDRLTGELADAAVALQPRLGHWQLTIGRRTSEPRQERVVAAPTIRERLQAQWLAGVGWTTSTGFDAIDRLCGPVRAGQLIVISAPAGSAPTRIAAAVTAHAVTAEPAAQLLYLSGAPDSPDLETRILAAMVEVPATRLASSRLSRTDLTNLTWAVSKLAQATIQIPRPPTGAADLAAIISSWRRSAPRDDRPRLIVVDGLARLARAARLQVDAMIRELAESACSAGAATIATIASDADEIAIVDDYPALLRYGYAAARFSHDHRDELRVTGCRAIGYW